MSKVLQFDMDNSTSCHGCGYITYESNLFSLPIIFIAIMSFFGNLTVIIVLISDRQLRPMKHDSNQLLYMFSMGLSDLGSAICFLIFPARYALSLHPPKSEVELDIGGAATYLFLTVSLFSIIGIGIDKLLNILFPYGYQRNWKRSHCLLSLIGLWLLIIFLSILPTKLFNIQNYYYKFNPVTFTFITQHEGTVSAMVITRIFMFFTLIAILGFGYFRLYLVTRKMKNEMPKFSVSGANDQQPCHQTGYRVVSKGTLMIFLILGSFLLLWMPYFFVQIGDAFAASRSVHMTYGRKILNFSLMWFAMLHTCVNVIIYSGIYRPFRKAMLRLLQINRDINSRLDPMTKSKNFGHRQRTNKTDILSKSHSGINSHEGAVN